MRQVAGQRFTLADSPPQIPSFSFHVSRQGEVSRSVCMHSGQSGISTMGLRFSVSIKSSAKGYLRFF